MMRALVTGVTGQDGSYLAEALLGAGQEVHGVVRDEPAALEQPATGQAEIASARHDSASRSSSRSKD